MIHHEEKTGMELMPSHTDLELPSPEQTEGQLKAILAFQEACHRHLVDEIDYGIIPGTSKPTLLKPGGEKILKILGLADEYEIESEKDWDRPLFSFQVTCHLRHIATGRIIATGVGECNSMEGRFRWRQGQRKCPRCDSEAIIKERKEYGGDWLCYKKKGGCGAKFPPGSAVIEEQEVGRVENDDICSQVNTILKVGKKRSMIDAALSAGRLSNIFTQDIEYMPLSEASVRPAPRDREQPNASPTSPANSDQPAPQTSNWAHFIEWLENQERTLGDVALAIGADATPNVVAAYIKNSGLRSFSEFTKWLQANWSSPSQGDAAEASREVVDLDDGADHQMHANQAGLT